MFCAVWSNPKWTVTGFFIKVCGCYALCLHPHKKQVLVRHRVIVLKCNAFTCAALTWLL